MIIDSSKTKLKSMAKDSQTSSSAITNNDSFRKSTAGARQANGVSLVELTVVVLVMSFVSAGIVGMLVTALGTNQKIQNKCDLVDGTRVALTRISNTVREGRLLSAASNGSRLIVQCPKFSDSGFPYRDMASNNDALETHTFDVVPDPNNAGEFIMQWSKDPGPLVPPSANPAKASINLPQGPVTIARGIIGPLAGANTPQVFRYISRNDLTTVQASPVGGVANFTGVVIDLETTRHDYSARDSQGGFLKPVTLAYKTELFLRNNPNNTQ